MGLPLTDDLGVVQSVADGVPVSWNSGLGYTSDGKLCTTLSLMASDVWIGGKRISVNGLLVVAVSSPSGQPFTYNAGWPSDNDTGATIYQSGTPAANDPRVAGIAIGPLGGLYMSDGTVTVRQLFEDDAVTPLYTDDGVEPLTEG